MKMYTLRRERSWGLLLPHPWPGLDCVASTSEDVEIFERYCDAVFDMMADMHGPEVVNSRPGVGAPHLVVTFEVAEVFVQTPGPGAGERTKQEGPT